MRLLAILLCLALAACSRNPAVRADGVTVTGNKNAGSPATLATTKDDEAIELHQGDEIVIVEKEAVAPVAATESSPAVKAEPATTTTTVRLGTTTNWRRNRATIKADTGTVDTSIAKHKIDVADRGKLLWVAIACGIAGLVLKSLMPAWPALSNGLLLASPLAFAAWKFAEVPAWLWLLVLGVVALLALGYKRAEWDKNGDHIPDILQRKPPTT